MENENEKSIKDLTTEEQLCELRLDLASEKDRVTVLEEKLQTLLNRFVHPSEL